ncbi:class I SAM-dependent methyltransferase [Liberibacter crescens]|uniref:class I SAM-dependent methyltransferase n=1 Tax=Liberibacter crescens TaxID=1273132 RepID=UPI001FCC106F|nr:class I SAM-dependent methyltransferase [Liberibacter crescens]
MKIYDWWVLGFSNSYVWRCPTSSVLLPFFQKYLSANHLDVGVGTGYYLAHSFLFKEQKIALFDLNYNSLEATRNRIKHFQPLLIQEDILNPTEKLGNQKFESISLFYLLHCLPGNMPIKAAAVFDFLRQHLTANGTLYGATILGDQVIHNWLGCRLMNLYNKKGIFDNQHDTLADLEATLSRFFKKISVRQHGKVAMFTAKLPT